MNCGATLRYGRNAGFTLTELTVVVSLVAVLILLVASILWGAVRVERADAALLLRITVQSQLADQFRSDVAQAINCPDHIGDLSADPHCLLLQLSGGYVAFRWTDNRLVRTEKLGDTETTHTMPVGGDDIVVTFEKREMPDRVITMRLIESRGSGTSQRDWPVLISATLGGDRR